MSDNPARPVVSIVIPAFNRPDYARRLLQSIVEQSYRPIEVILSDDCSPNSLEPLAQEFQLMANNDLVIRFFRHTTNLGVMGNFTFAVRQATGKYLVPFAHDNWFIDNDFLAEAVAIMESEPECHLCVANAVFENSANRMLTFPAYLDVADHWIVMEGGAFVRLWLKSPAAGGIGWTQVVVVDNHTARALRAFEEPYLVSQGLSQQLDIPQDNLMAFVNVLSAAGRVALTGKVVCAIGTPSSSYSRSKAWRRAREKTKFVVLFNVYKSNLEGLYAETVKFDARQMMLKYVLSGRVTPDLKIIQHYDYSLEVIGYMLLSLVVSPRILFRSVTRVLVRLKRGLLSVIRGDWSVLSAKIRASLTSK